MQCAMSLLLMVQKSSDHQLSLVVYQFIIPLFTTWFYTSQGGAGFLPSTAVMMMQQDFEGCTAVPSLAG